jgi:small subunit ribosomal protein S16
MLRIRLRRIGKTKAPSYRIVVADSKSPRDGAFIEILGNYEPLANPAVVSIDVDKAREWIRKGAKPSETVEKLLKKQGVLETSAAAS